jgi:DNA-binding NarL/FixJ family response regulator
MMNDTGTPTQGTRGPVVLCVDDEAEVLAALRRCLRNEPYELITALGPGEALARLREGPVDLVITDQRMPGMSGTELLYQVRERSPRTARVILTGYETPSTIRKGFECGADAFLYKPWDDNAFKATIRRILERGGRSEIPEDSVELEVFDIGGEGG